MRSRFHQSVFALWAEDAHSFEGSAGGISITLPVLAGPWLSVRTLPVDLDVASRPSCSSAPSERDDATSISVGLFTRANANLRAPGAKSGLFIWLLLRDSRESTPRVSGTQ